MDSTGVCEACPVLASAWQVRRVGDSRRSSPLYIAPPAQRYSGLPGRDRRPRLCRLCVPRHPRLLRRRDDHRGALPDVEPRALGAHVRAGAGGERLGNARGFRRIPRSGRSSPTPPRPPRRRCRRSSRGSTAPSPCCSSRASSFLPRAPARRPSRQRSRACRSRSRSGPSPSPSTTPLATRSCVSEASLLSRGRWRCIRLPCSPRPACYTARLRRFRCRCVVLSVQIPERVRPGAGFGCPA